jgi:hypothetical protein
MRRRAPRCSAGQTRLVDVIITDNARRWLIALADGLASDPTRAARVLGTLVGLCRDQMGRSNGSPTSGVAVEQGLDESIPGAWRVSWALSADGRTLTVGRVGPIEPTPSG